MAEGSKVIYIVLSDIHANFAALWSIEDSLNNHYPGWNGQYLNLDHAIRLDDTHSGLEEVKYEVLVLGDIAGYGPDINEVIQWVNNLRRHNPDTHFFTGNHDEGLAHLLGADFRTYNFNSVARKALEKQAEELTPENRDILLELLNQETYSQERTFTKLGRFYQIVFAHADITDPKQMMYVKDINAAAAILANMSEQLGVVGHTHVPQFYISHFGLGQIPVFGGKIRPVSALGNNQRSLWTTTVMSGYGMEHHHRISIPRNPEYDRNDPLTAVENALLVCPSAGQPRDGLNYAGYTVITNDPQGTTITIARVPYDVGITCQRLENQEYPQFLADRLRVGK